MADKPERRMGWADRYLKECSIIFLHGWHRGEGLLMLVLGYFGGAILLLIGLLSSSFAEGTGYETLNEFVTVVGFVWLLYSVLLLTPYRAWKFKTERLDTLTIPQLTIDHSPADPEIGHHYKTFDTQRVRVTNPTAENAENCQLRIRRLVQGDGKPNDDYGYPVRQTNYPRDEIFKLAAGTSLFFDVIWDDKTNANYIWLLHPDIPQIHGIRKLTSAHGLPSDKGPWELTLEAIGFGKPAVGRFRFERDKKGEIQFEQIEGG